MQRIIKYCCGYWMTWILMDLFLVCLSHFFFFKFIEVGMGCMKLWVLLSQFTYYVFVYMNTNLSWLPCQGSFYINMTLGARNIAFDCSEYKQRDGSYILFKFIYHLFQFSRNSLGQKRSSHITWKQLVMQKYWDLSVISCVRVCLSFFSWLYLSFILMIGDLSF